MSGEVELGGSDVGFRLVGCGSLTDVRDERSGGLKAGLRFLAWHGVDDGTMH